MYFLVAKNSKGKPVRFSCGALEWALTNDEATIAGAECLVKSEYDKASLHKSDTEPYIGLARLLDPNDPSPHTKIGELEIPVCVK